LKSYEIDITIDEIKAMMKTNGYGLLRKIEDEGWMAPEFLKADGLDGTEKIHLLRKWYNQHKPHQKIDEHGQLKLI